MQQAYNKVILMKDIFLSLFVFFYFSKVFDVICVIFDQTKIVLISSIFVLFWHVKSKFCLVTVLLTKQISDTFPQKKHSLSDLRDFTTA